MRVWVAALLSLVVGAAALADENWPQFRGPAGDGHSSATGLPTVWSETQNVRWKTPVPGKAWSSPVIWEGKIWVTNATPDGKVLSAVCVDLASGKVLRDVTVFEIAEPQFCHDMNSYATPTPVIEAGRIYVHYGSAGTACLDTANGEILWTRQDLKCNHFRGPASSPIVVDDLLYLTFDGYDLQYVAALDKKTGQTVWQKDRNIAYPNNNGDLKKAYSTPTLIEVGGRRQLVSPSAEATIAYDPKTGEELWRVHHGGMNAAAPPLFGHGLLFINTGYGGHKLFAMRPDGRGNVSKSHIEWTFGKSVPTRPSPLLIGDLLYMVSDTGIVSCLKAVTGESLWQERVEGAYCSAPLLADGKIYLMSETGTCPVLAVSPEFKVLATNELPDGFMASPAAVGKSLILRSRTALYCIEEQTAE